jgi:hypothetical protein
LARGASDVVLGAAGGLGRGTTAVGLARGMADGLAMGVAGPGSRATGGLARGTTALGRG